ncbi:extradiol dioxygenase [Caballeronia zhejiangensis]|uniref:Extradiol dioxygenase n=1 Tax=Caballeronia zhejiangensis TaxID=871203 RepID=A0A656Q8A4_9BURK|nr:extradiol dioxygenase [Caballeronia jiangsuensis]KDR24582.1 extradiol dioxygenase [Caballeronia zhejiangensis]
MPQIFVNLPVRDLPAAIAFFTALGYRFNPQYTDETATCMIVSDHIFVMLLTHEKFRAFSPRAIADTATGNEVLICLSCPDRAGVDDLVRKAVAAGGSTYSAPQDHGFMYGHGFQDLDGHVWELMAMNPDFQPPQG